MSQVGHFSIILTDQTYDSSSQSQSSFYNNCNHRFLGSRRVIYVLFPIQLNRLITTFTHRTVLYYCPLESFYRAYFCDESLTASSNYRGRLWLYMKPCSNQALQVTAESHWMAAIQRQNFSHLSKEMQLTIAGCCRFTALCEPTLIQIICFIQAVVVTQLAERSLLTPEVHSLNPAIGEIYIKQC